MVKEVDMLKVIFSEPLECSIFIIFFFFVDSDHKVHHDLHNRDPAFLKYKYSFAHEDQSKKLILLFLFYYCDSIYQRNSSTKRLFFDDALRFQLW